MLWCGASWVKRLRFWLNWGWGGLGKVWYFSPLKKCPSTQFLASYCSMELIGGMNFESLVTPI